MSDTLIRTVAVRLDVNGHAPLLFETAAAFNAAATWIARVCWDEGITNTNTVHHRVHGETRPRFGFGAQPAVRARAKAMEALKATRKKDSARCPTFGEQGSIPLRCTHLPPAAHRPRVAQHAAWARGLPVAAGKSAASHAARRRMGHRRR
jgi:hypothetical protein